MGIVSKYLHKKSIPKANYFIGGVSAILQTDEDVFNETKGLYAVDFTKHKFKNVTIVGDDVEVYVSSPFVHGSFAYISASMRSAFTYLYDIGGNILELHQNIAVNCSKLERLILPKCTGISSSGGYHTLAGTGIKGFFELPSFTGQLVMNHVFNNCKMTHIRYPVMTKLELQASPHSRRSHSQITTLKRVYMPLLTTIISFFYIDENFITSAPNNFYQIPSGTVMYLNPALETSRPSELLIRIAGVQAGDQITINGLIYTATESSTTGTHFKCNVNDSSTAKELASCINQDTRQGTLGSVVGYYQQYGNDTFLRVTQTIHGIAGDATTFSVSDATRFLTQPGNNFRFGGTEDTAVVYWRSRGAIIRYVDNFSTPNAPVSLSASNVTSTSFTIDFIPPVGHDKPIDFYEVWIDESATSGKELWQKYFAHQEISGPMSIVTGLKPNTQYKINIRSADSFWQVSEFSQDLYIQTTP